MACSILKTAAIVFVRRQAYNKFSKSAPDSMIKNTERFHIQLSQLFQSSASSLPVISTFHTYLKASSRCLYYILLYIYVPGDSTDSIVGNIAYLQAEQ